jgi:hypothetical protein
VWENERNNTETAVENGTETNSLLSTKLTFVSLEWHFIMLVNVEIERIQNASECSVEQEFCSVSHDPYMM